MANRKMLLGMLALPLIFGMAAASCGGKAKAQEGGGEVSSDSATKTSGEAFNLDLPLTYNVPTRFADSRGLPRLSAKSLFDEANLKNDTDNTVVCESKTAKNGTFTGVLLLSIGGKKIGRMSISLHPDSDGEFLYLTEVSFKSLDSGEVKSMSYDGTEGSAANLAGFFVGMLDYFYDKDKLLAK